jgi:hypothetical protein
MPCLAQSSSLGMFSSSRVHFVLTTTERPQPASLFMAYSERVGDVNPVHQAHAPHTIGVRLYLALNELCQARPVRPTSHWGHSCHLVKALTLGAHVDGLGLKQLDTSSGG